QVVDAVGLVEFRHQLAGDVGILGDLVALARVEVGGDGKVTLLGETAGNVADMIVEPPPLLDHDHRRTRAAALLMGDEGFELAGLAGKGHLVADELAGHGRITSSKAVTIGNARFAWETAPIRRRLPE